MVGAELVWMLWGREKPLAPDRNQTFDSPVVQAITYSTELSWHLRYFTKLF